MRRTNVVLSLVALCPACKLFHPGTVAHPVAPVASSQPEGTALDGNAEFLSLAPEQLASLSNPDLYVGFPCKEARARANPEWSPNRRDIRCVKSTAGYSWQKVGATPAEPFDVNRPEVYLGVACKEARARSNPAWSLQRQDVQCVTKGSGGYVWTKVGGQAGAQPSSGAPLSCAWNAAGYLSKNPDLGAFRPEQAEHHFVRYGIKEKRSWACASAGNSCPWTPGGYLAANPDLKTIAAEKVGFHYAQHGIKEGRVWACAPGDIGTAADGTSGFCPWTPEGYLASNSSVPIDQLQQHYQNFGMKEGRIWACLSFSGNPTLSAQIATAAQQQAAQQQAAQQQVAQQQNVQQQNVQQSAPAPSSSGGPCSFGSELLAIINQHRKGLGLGALQEVPAVVQAAQGHSANMAAGRVPFGHDGFQQRVGGLFVRVGAAENVSYSSSAQGSFSQWLHSTLHKANMEGQSWTQGGVGVASNGSACYVTLIVL